MHLVIEEYHLLGESFATGNMAFRPPWAIAESRFVHVCDRCGECVDVCPEHILVNGRGGFPQIEFSTGGCTFCGKCAAICRTGGLRSPDTHPWYLKAYIAGTCLTNADSECDACKRSCPENAITLRSQVGHVRVPIIEEMICNGCGSCVSACPVSAITV